VISCDNLSALNLDDASPDLEVFEICSFIDSVVTGETFGSRQIVIREAVKFSRVLYSQLKNDSTSNEHVSRVLEFIGHAALRNILVRELIIKYRHMGATGRRALAVAHPRRIVVPDRTGFVRYECAGMASHLGRRSARGSIGPTPGHYCLPVDPDAVPDRNCHTDDGRDDPAVDDHPAFRGGWSYRRALDAVVSIDRTVDRHT
jgi:hypothetical protein